MPEQVLLCGPAGSGKTDAVVSEYLEQVRAEGEDAALLLLPTRLACDRLQQRLIAEDLLPGLFDPRILTFPQLADLILHANHEAVAQISAWQRQLLMRWVAAELREQGALGALASLADYPGFIRTLCDLIDELKRAAVDPPQFQAGIAASGLDDARSHELARVYALYQHTLRERNLFDEAGRFWWARDVLSQGRRRPFESLRTVLVDGFEDFTTTQLQVLGLLAQGTERLVITLCLEDDERRQELFRSPRRTRDRLQEIFPDARVQWTPASSDDGALTACRAGSPTYAALRSNLFAEGHLVPVGRASSPPTADFEVIETSGRRAEVQQIAHRVKTLLLDGGAQPHQVAVVARDLASYSRALIEVFEEAGLPLYVATPEPVGARPPVQAALDILRVPANGYQRDDVLRLLKSNYLDLSRICPDAGVTPDEVERLACEANILGGREQWRERLQVYRSRIQGELATRRQGEREEEEQWFSESDEQLGADLAVIERAQVLLDALFASLERLSSVASPAEHVESLVALMTDFGLQARVGQVDRASVAAANVRAFGRFLEGLRELWGAEKQLGLSRPLTLDEFYRDVLEMSQTVQYQRHGGSGGRVLGVRADDARQLDFEHVFVVGLCEGEFPRTPREEALYSDQERRQLGRAGIALEPKVDEQYRDAFLFYSVATAAHAHLCLSYPTVDPEGREVIRSYYLDEVERCFARPVEPQRYDLAHLVADFGEITNPRELLERSSFELYGRDQLIGERRLDWGRSAINVVAGCSGELLRNVHGATLVEDRRDSLEPPDEYDGVLSAEAAVARLAEQFGVEHPFSAAQLAAYGRCPFAFFCERVLELEEMQTPSEEVEARLLGSLVHRCLSNFFTRWREHKENGRLEEGDLDAARDLMDAIINEVFEETVRRGHVADEVVFAISREEVRRDLHLLLGYEITEMQADGARPALFEQDFGMGAAERPSLLEIGEGDDAIRLRGRVDRLDLLPSEDAIPHFAVYDYKLSGGPSVSAIRSGEDFQLPVYALAARELVLQDPRAVCERWAYYRTRRPHKLEGKPGKDVDELLDAAIHHALAHAGAIRAGIFQPAPQDCRYCQYRSACRYGERRLAKKAPLGGDGNGG